MTKTMMDDFSLMACQDGSLTVHSRLHDQCFHSSAGAILESKYIYIELALKAFLQSQNVNNSASTEAFSTSPAPVRENESVSILEIGFGSGINALLCAIEFEQARRKRLNNSQSRHLTFPSKIMFESIELYPIPEEIWSKLDYASLLCAEKPGTATSNAEMSIADPAVSIPADNEELSAEEIAAIFEKIHRAPWNERCEILPGFILHKRHEDIQTFLPANEYQVVFFDAFSPDCQPQLWSKEVFGKIQAKMTPQAVMSTYSSKGFVKQNLRELGFDVRRKPGPGHKRHVLQIRL